MPRLKYWQAVREALREEMIRDRDVVLFGEDVGFAGGPYGASIGLQEQFGTRVRDTPISEQALMGVATGAALAGLRPVVEIMYMDFLLLASDQLINTAANMHWMSGGELTAPLVVRTLYGGGLGHGPQHGKSLEAWLCHVPGLKVVWPYSPDDAKGILKAAIRDDNPVVVIDSLSCWTTYGEVPDTPELVEIGVARIRRQGNDVTVVSWGDCVGKCLLAAEALAQDGIETEVIDLRTLSPMDERAIFKSVAHTKRLVIAHNAVRSGGLGAEIEARVGAELFGELKAPIQRVCAPFSPVPFSKVLENEYFPSAADIVTAVRAVVNYSAPAGIRNLTG